MITNYDVEAIRNDFPILKQKIHGKDLIYFDNAATTQKPQVVIDALTSFYTNINSNIHRGVHYLSQQSTDAYEEARKKVQKFLNTAHSHEVIFTRGTTEGVNLVAYSFGETFIAEGDEIIVSAMEHHSNLVPWQMLAERKKCKLRFIPFNIDGVLDMNVYHSLFTEKTRLVAVTYASNSLGTINPVSDIIAHAHKHNVPVLIDAAQAVQHIPIDVQKLDCDFLVFSGHKIYGPVGIGALYGKEKYLNAMVPWEGGGDMIKTVSLEKVQYNELPFKFEAGTTNFADAVALGVALDYVQNIGIENIAAHENSLTQQLLSGLKSFNNLTVYGNAPHRVGSVSFLLNGVHALDVGLILDKQGIAIRTGTHCTEPIMNYYKIEGTARASFGLYNTATEVDTFLNALKRTQSILM